VLLVEKVAEQVVMVVVAAVEATVEATVKPTAWFGVPSHLLTPTRRERKAKLTHAKSESSLQASACLKLSPLPHNDTRLSSESALAKLLQLCQRLLFKNQRLLYDAGF